MKRQASLLIDSSKVLYSSLIIIGVRFIAGVIVARTQGPEGMGVFTLVLTGGSLLVLSISMLAKDKKPAIGFEMKDNLAKLSIFSIYRLDTFLVNDYTGSGYLGLYSTAFGLAELLWLFPYMISAAWFPRNARLDPHIASRLSARTIRRALMISIPVAFVLSVTGIFLIPWVYSDRFRPSVIPYLYLLPGMGSLVVAQIISASFGSLGKPHYAISSSAITVFLTLVIDLALIPRYGIAGAASAFSIAFITSTIVILFFFRRKTGMPWRQILLFNRQDLTWMVRLVPTAIALIKSRLKKQFLPFVNLKNTGNSPAPSVRTSALQLRMIYRFHPGKELLPPTVPSGYRLLHYQPELETAWLNLINESGEFSKFTTQTFWTEILSGLIPEGGAFIEYQGKLVAAAAVCYRKEADPHAVLMYVVVLPEHRGLRLGQVITIEAIEAARQASYSGVVLYTDDERMPAIRMYLGLGFQPDLETQVDTRERWQRVFHQIKVETQGKS